MWSLFALLMLSETGSIQFVDERLIRKSVYLYDNINLNKLRLFSQRIEHKPSRAERTVTLMKGDYRFFANLYVACQLRAGDLVFAHKSHGFPVSLCKYEKLTQVRIYRLSAKLERNPPDVQAIVVDGAALVHSNCSEKKIKTYGAYSKEQIAEKIHAFFISNYFICNARLKLATPCG